MADRPIIFSAPMVQALLAGRKSQTRRVLKPQPNDRNTGGAALTDQGWAWLNGWDGSIIGRASVPYAPGDRLWVREAWRVEHRFNTHSPIPHDSAVQYPADDPLSVWDSRLRPSTQLPRWSSRLTYIVTDVRVQRLQEISEADAVAEGCDAVLALTIKRPNGAHPGNPRECYCDLWNSLHGPGAWDANPWVVALTFTVQCGNIDQIGDANG